MIRMSSNVSAAGLGASTRLAGPRILFAELVRRAGLWLSLREERRALADLDARMRADIGVTEVDAFREAARPFWDVPAGR